MTEKLNVGMVSLGCDKNRVDAEHMLGILSDKDYNIVNDENNADIIIINTCGFIESAKKESIDAILKLSESKINGRCRALIASGCLAERYSDELLKEIPELDAVVGVGNYMEIDSIIRCIIAGESGIKRTNNINYDVDFNSKRILTTPVYTAYIKIAEGCNNCCSYCIIPKLRGDFRSRRIENIYEEIDYLSKNGTKEVILIAQDTSKYGIDIYGRKMLPDLIRKISEIQGIEWVRILYCYPEDIDDALIEEIRNNNKVCKYIDIPIQHINNKILIDMRRSSNKKNIEDLIIKLRERIPGIVIRTSLIVGFPGETEEQFMELYNFIDSFEIDKVGIFTYSMEEGTDAALFNNQIDEKVKKIRQKKLLSLQKKVSMSNNKKRVGKTYKALVEGIKEDGLLIGRTYSDSPQIDGVVFIKENINHIEIGDFTNIKIISALNYDLVGEVEYESSK